MKIIEFTAENVKKLRVVHIAPDGPLVTITGANGSGKSSVLDAIYMALAGKDAIPSKPVRAGAAKARIKLDLGDIVVTRRFTEAGGTSLTVEAADGAKYPSPQRMLDELLGALAFDPLAFSRMEPKQQLEQLRTLVPIDLDIDGLDAAVRADYDARTEVNRQVKRLRAEADGIVVPEGTPAELVDVAALSAELQAAGDHNADIERRKANREQARTKITELDGRAAAARQEAADLRARADALTETAAQAERQAIDLQEKLAAAGDLPEKIDTAVLTGKIQSAAATNRAVEQRQRRATLASQIAEAESRAANLTRAIEDRQADRAAAIARAPMPVAGLAFGDGEVLYNGLPFAQACSAEQLRVSVAIAMAANPKLRVLRIKDGSLLDENGLASIAEMAAAGDYQVWIERVDTTGKVGIVMEDGAVRGAPASEAEAAE